MKNNEAGMTLIVKTITRLTVGLIFLYGVYIVLHGHIGPGGGFAGGIIIALSFIHVLLAYGKGVALKKLTQGVAIIIMGLAAAVFLSIAVAGFLGLRFPIAPLCDMVIAVMAAMALFAIFLALTLFKGGSKE